MPVRPQSDVDREHVAGMHQHDDTSARGILLGIVVLLITLATVQFGILWVIDAFAAWRPVTVIAPGTVRDPSVVHWTEPRSDLAALRRKEQALLQQYGWVDPGRGVARIPIDKAIELIASRKALPFPRNATHPNEQDGAREERDSHEP
jgi:hypothetical protein